MAEPETGSGASQEAEDQRYYELFVAIFGVAFLIFYAERDFTTEVVAGPLPMTMAVPGLFAVAMALFPSRVPLFLGFFLSYTYLLALSFPNNNTNQTLTFFVGLGVLGSAAACAIEKRSFDVSGAELFRRFQPVLQLCVVALYFFTIWHKLNFDFVDPEVSCSRRLSARLFLYFGGKIPDILGPAAVALTILAETALPVGLAFRRTQVWTALFGLGFHYLLGLAGFYGFSVTMMALLPLFIMPTLARAVSGYTRPHRVTINRLSVLAYVGLMLVAKARNVHTGWVTGHLFVAVPIAVGALLWLNWGKPGKLEPGRSVGDALRQPTWLWLVPGLVVLNGLSPFLGFKTEYSYAMYSNLRTEGGKSNHLIWRRPLALFGYQTDLVRVLPGSDAELDKALGGRPVTRYELTSLLWGLVKEKGRRDIALVLEDGGRTRTTARAEAEADLVVEPGYWEKTLLKFRKIVPPEKGHCAH